MSASVRLTIMSHSARRVSSRFVSVISLRNYLVNLGELNVSYSGAQCGLPSSLPSSRQRCLPRHCEALWHLDKELAIDRRLSERLHSSDAIGLQVFIGNDRTEESQAAPRQGCRVRLVIVVPSLRRLGSLTVDTYRHTSLRQSSAATSKAPGLKRPEVSLGDRVLVGRVGYRRRVSLDQVCHGGSRFEPVEALLVVRVPPRDHAILEQAFDRSRVFLEARDARVRPPPRSPARR